MAKFLVQVLVCMHHGCSDRRKSYRIEIEFSHTSEARQYRDKGIRYLEHIAPMEVLGIPEGSAFH